MDRPLVLLQVEYSPTLKKSIGFCSVPLNVSIDQVTEIDIGGKMYEAKIIQPLAFINENNIF